MGKIYYLMGKSATGKDTIYAELLDRCKSLNRIILYTTRPMRDGEQEAREYHFTDSHTLERFAADGKLIEMRTYNTVDGPWSYATVDDGQVEIENNSYLIIGTLESYIKVRAYYGEDRVIPIYITIDDLTRLQRALQREAKQQKPNYAEVCRRYLADEKDFSQENLLKAGIKKSYNNIDLEVCIDEIREDISI